MQDFEDVDNEGVVHLLQHLQLRLHLHLQPLIIMHQ